MNAKEFLSSIDDENGYEYINLKTVEKWLEEYATLRVAESKQSEWVKVSERMPKEDEEVLILYVTDVVQAYLHNGWWKASGTVTDAMQDGYVADRRICKQADMVEYVTHWMPLPIPPTP